MKLLSKIPTHSLYALAFWILHGNIPVVNAHYGFPYLNYDGVMSSRWEYTRPSTTFHPFFDYEGPDVACGWNGSKPLFPIKTLEVEAGSVIGFGSAGIQWVDESKDFGPWDRNYGIFHDGPGYAYLSKLPDHIDNLDDYPGNGDWFKIGVIGSSNGISWDAGRINPLNFTIPEKTPPGKYLLRVEHLNMMTRYKATQMYISCSHIEISGLGGGTPGPLAKFPGAYSAKDPGIWLPAALYYPYEPKEELKNWQGAGPTVWDGN